MERHHHRSATGRTKPGRERIGRTRHAELLILCARIGFNP
jgi:hypothetical protein